MLSRKKPFIIYLLVNLFLVWSVITFYFSPETSGKRGVGPEMYFSLLSISALIIFLQYRPIKESNSWLFKLFYFYLSMLSFLICFGIMTTSGMKVGSNDAGSILALLDGTLRMVVFGHLFAGITLPVIVFINIILKDITHINGNRIDSPT